MAVILFVDDEPDILKALQKSVEMFGHQALLAKSGQEAIELAASGGPDMIFIDIRLDDQNGFELLEKLRMLPQTARIPVVMLSAGAELDAEELALSAGAVAYLQKPIRLQTLLDVVEKQLARRDNDLINAGPDQP